jgi:multiple sugar transport system ATP-binding protein
MNLYTKPANLFVAGFLGSPAMNFFHGTLRRDGNELTLECANANLNIGAGLDWLAAHAGRQVVAGIRPEELRPDAAPLAAPASLQAQLEVIEPVGNEVFLNLSHAGAPIVARTPLRELPQPGSVMTLAYAPAAMHFFDAASTARIGV